MAPPELPLELQQHILDEFSCLIPSDRETLKSCNLVCRAWSWNARSRFWTVIESNNTRDCCHLLSVLEESARVTLSERFSCPRWSIPASMRCELLRRLTPHMSMVKCLHVKASTSAPCFTTCTPYLASMDYLPQFNGAFPSVLSLSIHLLFVTSQGLGRCSM
ncbi:uncharacterized protein B0H18DRAFT_994705 [Fomitopsis serialis]|uniref:uncharacterized protein n=1 Tax=Fomitopsis serialis TaxID=139415 RepID=UPI0020076BE9|nr:uncharacterized protein B0H18DRAFT_994705 [Neoantrodia serialis]KAH9929987.1 hypothetical protein B0H18DRAFT_994705 [Neoantrodia serialis]